MSQIYEALLIDHNLQTPSQTSKRNHTLDFARGLAVLFMVLVHVLMTYSNINVQSSDFGFFIDFLGSPPAAPVFMFTMGIFFMLSSRASNLKTNITRGIKLLIISIVFSFFRSDILSLLGSDIRNFDSSGFVLFWEVDILQFAGWAYIFMSLVKYYIKKPVWWVVIAVTIMLVAPLLWGLKSDVKFVDWLLNYLWGNSDLTYFPVFSWLYYPLLGMAFGVLLNNSDDIKQLFKSFMKLGLILLLIGSLICLPNLDYHMNSYFHSSYGLMVWITGFILVWLWLINIIVEKAENNKIVKLINYWGKQTTTIYIIHWFLISWATLILGYESFGYAITIIIMFSVMLITHYMSKVIRIKI